MNPVFYKIVNTYRSLGTLSSFLAERRWEAMTKASLPSFSSTPENLTEWLDRHGAKYLAFLSNNAVFASPTEVKPVKLAISCLLKHQDPMQNLTEKVSAMASDLQVLKTHLTKASVPAPAEDLSVPPSMRNPQTIDEQTINDILSFEPDAKNIQETMENELPLTSESSLIKMNGQFLLYNSAEDLTVPLKDEELQKILEDDSELTSEDVTVEGVEGQASLKSYHGIPLWFKGLAEDYLWSESSSKARIKEFLRS